LRREAEASDPTALSPSARPLLRELARPRARARRGLRRGRRFGTLPMVEDEWWAAEGQSMDARGVTRCHVGLSAALAQGLGTVDLERLVICLAKRKDASLLDLFLSLLLGTDTGPVDPRGSRAAHRPGLPIDGRPCKGRWATSGLGGRAVLSPDCSVVGHESLPGPVGSLAGCRRTNPWGGRIRCAAPSSCLRCGAAAQRTAPEPHWLADAPRLP
jgi:hypothetical protein